MESPVLKFLRDGSGPDLTILTYTKTITPEDIEVHDKWSAIKQWYEKTESHPDARWVDKAVTTIINSAIYQERLCFCLSSRSIEKLMRQDKNWKEPLGYSPKNYKPLIGRLTKDLNILECIFKGKGQSASAYQIIDQGLLSLIQGKSLEEQRAEVVDFATNKKDISLELLEETYRETQQGNATGKQVRQSDSQLVRQSDSQTGTVLPSEPETKVVSTDKEKKKHTFKALIEMQGWPKRDFPQFEDLTILAQYTMENCEEIELDLESDFDVPHSIMSTLGKELLSKVDGKPSRKKRPGQKWSQEELYKRLMAAFKSDMESYFYQLVAANADLVEPTVMDNVSKIKAKKLDKFTEENVVQENTLRILESAFEEDKVQKIKTKLEMDLTPTLRQKLEKKLEYYQQKELLYGRQ